MTHQMCRRRATASVGPGTSRWCQWPDPLFHGHGQVVPSICRGSTRRRVGDSAVRVQTAARAGTGVRGRHGCATVMHDFYGRDNRAEVPAVTGDRPGPTADRHGTVGPESSGATRPSTPGTTGRPSGPDRWTATQEDYGAAAIVCLSAGARLRGYPGFPPSPPCPIGVSETPFVALEFAVPAMSYFVPVIPIVNPLGSQIRRCY